MLPAQDQVRATPLLLEAHLLTLLLATSLFLFIFAGFTLVYVSGLLVTSYCGVRVAHRIYVQPSRIRFAHILAAALLLGYGFGGLVNFIGIREFTIAEQIYNYFYEELRGAICIALGLVAFAAAALIWLGRFEPPLFDAAPTFSPNLGTAALLLGVLTIVAIGFLTGGLGFGGIVANEGSQLSAFQTIAFSSNQSGAVLAFFCILQSRTRSQKILFGLICLCLAIAIIPQGRRLFMFTCLMMAFTYHLAVAKRRKINWLSFKTLALGGLGIVATYFAFVLFFAMRDAGNQLIVEGANTSFSFVERLMRAFEIAAGGGSTDFSERLTANIIERPFILRYLAILVDASGNISLPMLGEDFLYAIRMATPSVLYPGKELLPGAEEVLINPHFGLPVFDDANTIVVSGFADWFWFGAVVYPVLIVALYSGVAALFRRFLNPTVYLMAAFGLAVTLLHVEIDLGGLIVGIRNYILIVIIASVFMKVTELFSRRPKLQARTASTFP